MASPIDYITKGTQILLSSLKNRYYHKKYSGRAEEICRTIVKDCWNGTYFQTSATNFKEFWARDFGWCVQSLLKIGYKSEVHLTLRYALNRYKKYKKITTTINKGGKPYDIFIPAVDSLPWLIHSIHVSRFPYHSFRNFLNKEIEKFVEQFLDQKTGLVKRNIHASSIKDFSIRESSCYDNCMVGLLAKDLREMKLNNPLSKFNYPQLIKENFWNGLYFYDDLKKKDYVAGDANIFPFILGLCRDTEMLESALQTVQSEGLDQPLPLKYTSSREGIRFGWQEFFFKNYESNSIWMHMGPLFIKLLREINTEKADEYKEKYREVIEQYSGYPEVLSSDGKPYSSLAYYTDFSMLWACNYLTL